MEAIITTTKYYQRRFKMWAHVNREDINYCCYMLSLLVFTLLGALAANDFRLQ